MGLPHTAKPSALRRGRPYSIAPRIPPDQPLSAELWKGSLGSSLVGWVRSIGEAGKEAGTSDQGRDHRPRVASKSLGRVASKSLGRILCRLCGITIARSPTLSIGGSIGRLPFLGAPKIGSPRSSSTSPSVAPSVDRVVFEGQTCITIISVLLLRTVAPSVACVFEAPKKFEVHRSPSTSPLVAPSVDCVCLEGQTCITIIWLLLSRTVAPSVGCVLEVLQKIDLHRSPSTSPTVAPSVDCSLWRYTQKGWCQNRTVAKKGGAFFSIGSSRL